MLAGWSNGHSAGTQQARRAHCIRCGRAASLSPTGGSWEARCHTDWGSRAAGQGVSERCQRNRSQEAGEGGEGSCHPCGWPPPRPPPQWRAPQHPNAAHSSALHGGRTHSPSQYTQKEKSGRPPSLRPRALPAVAASSCHRLRLPTRCPPAKHAATLAPGVACQGALSRCPARRGPPPVPGRLAPGASAAARPGGDRHRSPAGPRGLDLQALAGRRLGAVHGIKGHGAVAALRMRKRRQDARGQHGGGCEGGTRRAPVAAKALHLLVHLCPPTHPPTTHPRSRAPAPRSPAHPPACGAGPA